VFDKQDLVNDTEVNKNEDGNRTNMRIYSCSSVCVFSFKTWGTLEDWNHSMTPNRNDFVSTVSDDRGERMAPGLDRKLEI
jgi:hypothetical protein